MVKDPFIWLVFLAGVVVGVVAVLVILAARGVVAPVENVQLPTVAPVAQSGGVA